MGGIVPFLFGTYVEPTSRADFRFVSYSGWASGDPLKAFLLAAGHGTRLRPLTDKIPKCLVPICGVPMLEIWLKVFSRAGIDEVLVNLHSHADVVRAAMRGRTDGIQVDLVEESVLLGSAGTLAANRDWIANDSHFWVIYADVLTNTNLNRMQDLHRRTKPRATIGAYRVEDPKRCGIISFDEDLTVNEFVEKPSDPKSNWAFSGIMIADRSLLDLIPPKLPSDLGFDVLPGLAGEMKAFPINEYVLDIGTMDNYKTAQSTWPGL